MARFHCTVCGKEKDESEYQVYWHSTFGKFYRRKQCNTCFYQKHKEYKQKIAQQKKKIEIPQPETKNCWRCGEDYFLEDYWGLDKKGNIKILRSHNPPCYNCRQEIQRMHTKFNYVDPNGDYKAQVEKILAPGKYVSEHQKEITYMAMEAMGFKLNEKLNIWWKPGFRKENGQFEFL